MATKKIQKEKETKRRTPRLPKKKSKKQIFDDIKKEKQRLIDELKGRNKDEGHWEHRCPDCSKGLYTELETIRLSGLTLADLGGCCQKCRFYHCVEHRLIEEEETNTRYNKTYYLCHTCAIEVYKDKK